MSRRTLGTIKKPVTGTGLTDPMTTRGDVIVRNSSNVTARLAVGAASKVLQSDGTDVSYGTAAVAGGGTGATTLTDGGVLLGSGTGAITPMAVLSDGEFIVGNGTTDPVAESGATVLASLTIANHDSISITSSGEATNDEQPCFLVYNSATDSNVTGNGAAATVDFDTEVFDQGANFASDTFTAPVTGLYQLNFNVGLSGITSTANVSVVTKFVTSNRTHEFTTKFVGGLQVDPYSLPFSAIVDMDASDTVTITLTNTGETGDDHDIVGNSSLTTSLSGCLLA